MYTSSNKTLLSRQNVLLAGNNTLIRTWCGGVDSSDQSGRRGRKLETDILDIGISHPSPHPSLSGIAHVTCHWGRMRSRGKYHLGGFGSGWRQLFPLPFLMCLNAHCETGHKNRFFSDDFTGLLSIFCRNSSLYSKTPSDSICLLWKDINDELYFSILSLIGDSLLDDETETGELVSWSYSKDESWAAGCDNGGTLDALGNKGFGAE